MCWQEEVRVMHRKTWMGTRPFGYADRCMRRNIDHCSCDIELEPKISLMEKVCPKRACSMGSWEGGSQACKHCAALIKSVDKVMGEADWSLRRRRFEKDAGRPFHQVALFDNNTRNLKIYKL